jgi:hypothetical protein
MSDLDLIYGTTPKTVSHSEEKLKEKQKPALISKEPHKKAIKKESRSASTQASKIARLRQYERP